MKAYESVTKVNENILRGKERMKAYEMVQKHIKAF